MHDRRPAPARDSKNVAPTVSLTTWLPVISASGVAGLTETLANSPFNGSAELLFGDESASKCGGVVPRGGRGYLRDQRDRPGQADRTSLWVIGCYAALASQQVNFCLVPEVPFELHGSNGFLEALRYRIAQRKHAVVVVAEGAGQQLLGAGSMETDASGNRRLGDIGLFLKDEISHFSNRVKSRSP